MEVVYVLDKLDLIGMHDYDLVFEHHDNMMAWMQSPDKAESKAEKIQRMPWLDKKSKMYAKRNTGLR